MRWPGATGKRGEHERTGEQVCRRGGSTGQVAQVAPREVDAEPVAQRGGSPGKGCRPHRLPAGPAAGEDHHADETCRKPHKLPRADALTIEQVGHEACEHHGHRVGDRPDPRRRPLSPPGKQGKGNHRVHRGHACHLQPACAVNSARAFHRNGRSTSAPRARRVSTSGIAPKSGAAIRMKRNDRPKWPRGRAARAMSARAGRSQGRPPWHAQRSQFLRGHRSWYS